MTSVSLPEDCAKQWEVLLLLLSAEEKKVIKCHDSEINTMNYFRNNEGVRKILLQWMTQMRISYARKTSESDTSLKCDEVSVYWRQQGNDKFRANLAEEAYQCYSKSVIFAKQDGDKYPLALANRSAALLRLKRYKECLSDITLALSSGYPQESAHKLLLRRVDCYIEMGSRKDAMAAYNDVVQHTATYKLGSAQADVDKQLAFHEKKLETLGELNVNDEPVKLPDCHLGPNKEFICASNAIDLRNSEAVGRHVVTNAPTNRGDVLFSEEPYAWVTLPCQLTVCETCCRADINPLPCASCSRTVYCDQACRSRGDALFHRWECVGAQANLFPTIGIAHLALRVLLISASIGFPAVPPDCKLPKSAADLFQSYAAVDNIRVYNESQHAFYRMFNLVTNFTSMNSMDYTQYALTATMLTLYLEECTSFFEYLPSRIPYQLNKDELRLFAAGIVLRSMGQLVCNGHAALSLSLEAGDENGCTVTEREVRRATAIYPSAAMMNHSCDPNIINTFHNSRLIVRSSGNLPSNAQVFNCYGPHKARSVTSQRRSCLRAQYMFHCQCVACSADKGHRDTVLVFSAYACQSCKGPVIWSGQRAQCQQCNNNLHVQRALSTLDRAQELDAQAERASSLEEKCDRAHAAFRLRQQVWHRHHSSLRSNADSLARLYADAGDFGRSVELIKQNIQSLEYQFGSFSVEVAHELRKLADVMLQRILNVQQHADYRDWCLETHKIAKKAVQLMELNYGSWEPLVARLKEQEAFVNSLLAKNKTPDSDYVHHNFHYNLKI